MTPFTFLKVVATEMDPFDWPMLTAYFGFKRPNFENWPRRNLFIIYMQTFN